MQGKKKCVQVDVKMSEVSKQGRKKHVSKGDKVNKEDIQVVTMQG